MPAVVIVVLMGRSVSFNSRVIGSSAASKFNEGALTSADLKGWMTRSRSRMGLDSVETVYTLAGLRCSVGAAETALKDIEGLVEGFEVSGPRDAADSISRRFAGGGR